jgi:hypothetical protein
LKRLGLRGVGFTINPEIKNHEKTAQANKVMPIVTYKVLFQRCCDGSSKIIVPMIRRYRSKEKVSNEEKIYFNERLEQVVKIVKK